MNLVRTETPLLLGQMLPLMASTLPLQLVTLVRDLLIQQLNGSGSSSLVTPTELVEPTTRIDDNIPIDSSIPQIEIHNENNVEIHGTDASTISNSSARRSSVNSERGGTINGHSEDGH